MFEEQNIEIKIDNTDKKITELEIRNQKLDRDTSDLLEELEVSPEQLSSFIEDDKNFTEQNWEKLQDKRQRLNQKLQTELNSLHNPLQSKKTQAERNINHQWLFIK